MTSEPPKDLYDSLMLDLPPVGVDPELEELIDNLDDDSWKTPAINERLEQESGSLITRVNSYSTPTNRIRGNSGLKLENHDVGATISLNGKEYFLSQEKNNSARMSGRNQTVFRARDLVNGDDVAIKQFAGEEEYAIEKGIQGILAVKRHKNILLAKEFVDEYKITVSPYARGGNLRSLLKRNSRLSPSQTRLIISSLCDALQYMHEQEVTHRDVKSTNSVFEVYDDKMQEVTPEDLECPKGRFDLKMIDFEFSRHDHVHNPRFENVAVGTLHYLDAVGFRQGRNPFRCDIYSLSVILYECLTGGVFPFNGENNTQIIDSHLFGSPLDIIEFNPNVTVDQKYVVERGFSKDLSDRWQTAQEFKEAWLSVI